MGYRKESGVRRTVKTVLYMIWQVITYLRMCAVSIWISCMYS